MKARILTLTLGEVASVKLVVLLLGLMCHSKNDKLSKYDHDLVLSSAPLLPLGLLLAAAHMRQYCVLKDFIFALIASSEK